jgi:hypothetical protein
MKIPSQFHKYNMIILCSAVIFAGILFRSLGITLDFWGDEAWLATRLSTEPLHSMFERPIGYLWLCKQIGDLTNNNLFYRLPSYLAGIGTIIIIFLAAKSLYKHYLTVLVVLFLVALHPKLIVFAKEFKPYSVEVFIHSGVLYWAWLCIKNGKASSTFIVTTTVACLFSYNLVFLYPGLVLALYSKQLKEKLKITIDFLKNKSEYRFLFVVSFIFFIVAVVFIIDPLFSSVSQRRSFWGNKYNVFPISLEYWEFAKWYFIKTWELINMAGELRGKFSALTQVFSWFFFSTYITGIIILVRKRQYPLLYLLCGTLLCTLLANLLWLWPYGAFRTNIFLIPSTLLIFGYGLDWFFSLPKIRIIWGGVMIIALINFSSIALNTHKFKHADDWAPSPQLSEVLNEIQDRYKNNKQFNSNIIIADWHSWRPIRYYLITDPAGKINYREIRENVVLVRGPLNDQDRLRQYITEEYAQSESNKNLTRVWVVVTKLTSFKTLHSTPVFKEYTKYSKEFAVHDKHYHPQLYELHF